MYLSWGDNDFSIWAEVTTKILVKLNKIKIVIFVHQIKGTGTTLLIWLWAFKGSLLSTYVVVYVLVSEAYLTSQTKKRQTAWPSIERISTWSHQNVRDNHLCTYSQICFLRIQTKTEQSPDRTCISNITLSIAEIQSQRDVQKTLKTFITPWYFFIAGSFRGNSGSISELLSKISIIMTSEAYLLWHTFKAVFL